MAHFTGARKAILIATSIHMSTPNPFEPKGGGGKGNGGLIAAACEAGRIIAAMDRNPEPLRSWVWVTYAAFHSAEQYQRMLAALWHGYLEKRRPAEDRRAKLRALSVFAFDDYRRRLCTGKAKYTHEQLAKAISVPPGSFWKLWEPEIVAMRDIMDAWDRRGLAPVAAEVHEMQDEYERERDRVHHNR